MIDHHGSELPQPRLVFAHFITNKPENWNLSTSWSAETGCVANHCFQHSKPRLTQFVVNSSTSDMHLSMQYHMLGSGSRLWLPVEEPEGTFPSSAHAVALAPWRSNMVFRLVKKLCNNFALTSTFTSLLEFFTCIADSTLSAAVVWAISHAELVRKELKMQHPAKHQWACRTFNATVWIYRQMLFVHIYIYISLYIYLYLYISLYISIYIFISIYMYLYIYIYIYII